MDYRLKFFSALNMKYTISFLFLWPSPLQHDFNCDYCSRRIDRLTFFWISPQDIRKLRAGIRRSDLFVSSNIWNPYTIIGLVLCRLLGDKIIVWSEFNYFRPGLGSAVKYTLMRIISAHVDAFFIQGLLQKNALTKLGVPPEKIFMANEYPAQVYSEAKEQRVEGLQISQTASVVLFIGRLVEFKGVEYLIRAFTLIEQKYDDTTLLIVGDGPLRSHLETLAKTLGTKSIMFLGRVTDTQKAHLLNRCTIVVVPSIATRKAREGSGPLVVLEALSAGKAVVGTTALGGSGAFLQNGVNGFIVPEKDANALAQKIERLLANPIPASRVLSTFSRIRGVEFQVEQFQNAVNHALAQP